MLAALRCEGRVQEWENQHTGIGGEICGDDPAGLVETLELVHDGDQRCANDGCLEGRKQQANAHSFQRGGGGRLAKFAATMVYFG